MATTVEISDATWRELNSRKTQAGESFDDVIQRLLGDTDEPALYSHASVVQLKERDPRNDRPAGTIQIVAGNHGDTYEYTILDEDSEGFADIECDVLTVLEAPYRMPKAEIEAWAADQDQARQAAQGVEA